MNIENPRIFIFRSLGVLLLLGIIFFAYFRFSRYIKGPEITNINLEEFQQTNSLIKHIETEFKNTQKISLNNRELHIIEKKNIKEIIALSPGLNKIILSLEDPFGKKRDYIYTVYSTESDDNYPKDINEARELLEQETESETDE